MEGISETWEWELRCIGCGKLFHSLRNPVIRRERRKSAWTVEVASGSARDDHSLSISTSAVIPPLSMSCSALDGVVTSLTAFWYSPLLNQHF